MHFQCFTDPYNHMYIFRKHMTHTTHRRPHDQPSGYRLTIYRFVVIVWFSKYRWNIVIAFFFENITQYLPHLPGLENGPGFDSQGSVNFFTKYCFPNLRWIHVKAFEVEDCEFVPVHHQQKTIFNYEILVYFSLLMDLWKLNNFINFLWSDI